MYVYMLCVLKTSVDFDSTYDVIDQKKPRKREMGEEGMRRGKEWEREKKRAIKGKERNKEEREERERGEWHNFVKLTTKD